jgi:hypothetical protein
MPGMLAFIMGARENFSRNSGKASPSADRLKAPIRSRRRGLFLKIPVFTDRAGAMVDTLAASPGIDGAGA